MNANHIEIPNSGYKIHYSDTKKKYMGICFMVVQLGVEEWVDGYFFQQTETHLEDVDHLNASKQS